MNGRQTAARQGSNNNGRSNRFNRSGRTAARARAAGAALLAALAVFGQSAHAAPAAADGALASYAAIEQALMDGHSVVNVRLEMSRCTSTEGNKPGPAIRGGVSIGSFLIPEGRYIAFIDEHQTLDPKNHPVTEYVRYHVMPDNTVTIDTAFAANGADTASSRGSYRCTINEGIRFIAAAAR
ncbi:VirK family protein [Paraburkholderia edwinii]|uniref:VirK family protein n=1 Tax=Paraburkholderia edwinii TaxID=2861782 RepID=A0ABX8UXA3_9BURK|nr:VirK family protein [Paraburkholderia edwinii]QYD73648.1 VirK family protein [Paraburkholderia edwinii]